MKQQLLIISSFVLVMTLASISSFAAAPRATCGPILSADRVDLIITPAKKCLNINYDMHNLRLRNARFNCGGVEKVGDVVFMNIAKVDNFTQYMEALTGVITGAFPVSTIPGLPSNAGYTKNWLEAGSQISQVHLMTQNGGIIYGNAGVFSCDPNSTEMAYYAVGSKFLLNVAHEKMVTDTTNLIYRATETIDWESGF